MQYGSGQTDGKYAAVMIIRFPLSVHDLNLYLLFSTHQVLHKHVASLFVGWAVSEPNTLSFQYPETASIHLEVVMFVGCNLETQ